MSETPSNNRIKCPGCDASLAVSRDGPSPYIRCGVCKVLFEIRSDLPATISPSVPEKRKPPPSQTLGTHSPSPYEDPQPQNDYTSRSRIPRITDHPRQRQSGFFTFVVIIVGLGFLFYFAVFRTVTIPQHGPHAITFRTDKNTIAIEDFNPPLQVKPEEFIASLEINLNGESPKKFNPNTVKVSLDGRNFSQAELFSILSLENLKFLSYTGVKLNSDDLKLIQSKRLNGIDLSRSSWKSGQLMFNKKNYPVLFDLNLAHSSVRGFALSGLKDIARLTNLNLRGTEIEDSDLKSLYGHSGLNQLDVCFTKVTFDGLMDMNLPNLKKLKISPDAVTAEQLISLIGAYPKTEILVIPEMNTEESGN